jgi:hypothetical protein
MGANLILPQTRQTWRNKPVRELFAEIREAHPNATEDMLRRRFKEAAREDDEYLDAILDYAFDAASRAYEKQTARVAPTIQQRANVATQRAAALQSHAERVEYIKEQIILLNQEMPNGKRARYCTLDYMYRLGGKFRLIGKQGSQKQVGEAYSEETYRAKLGGLAA